MRHHLIAHSNKIASTLSSGVSLKGRRYLAILISALQMYVIFYRMYPTTRMYASKCLAITSATFKEPYKAVTEVTTCD